MTLALRVSNSQKAGLGHFNRCLSIRDRIEFKVVWFLDSKSSYYKGLIKKEDIIYYEKDKSSCLKLVAYLKKSKASLVLVDSNYIVESTINELSALTKTVVLTDKVIDCEANIIVSSHNLKIKKKKGLLLGPKYALISRKLKRKYILRKKKKEILLSMGAVDSKGFTLIVVKTLIDVLKHINHDFRITILLSNFSPIIEDVRKLINKNKNFSLIVDIKDISSFYKKVDLAIGSLGVSFLERLYVGIPNLILIQNDIQMNLIRYWNNKKCAKIITKLDTNFSEIVLNFLYAHKIHNTFVENGKKLVDGKGTDRVLKNILELYQND